MPPQPITCRDCHRTGMFKTDPCGKCRRSKRMRADPVATPPSDAAWRPKHFPPACPTCNGWPYTPGGSKCSQCRSNPGHLYSHEEWTKRRTM